MPPKRKGQSTINNFYGYSKTSKTSNVKDIPSIPDLNDDANEDVNEEFVVDHENHGHGKEGQDGGSSSSRRKAFSKREFREEWMIKHPWVYSINVEYGKIRMKCKICEKYKAQGPWGIGDGCNTIQYDAITTHAKSIIHQTSTQKNLYETERLAKPIT